jgi:arylsulfatase
MGEHVQREVLPIPDRGAVNLTTYDAKDPDTSFPPIKPLRPPEGAPNVLVVLLDDVGFGASRTFGGPANTPTLDRLAENGLRYTRFHTTSLRADKSGAAVRAKPPHGRDGRDR